MGAFKLKETVSPYRCGSSIGVRVYIQCIASDRLSPKVFAYGPSTIIEEGKFNHVCNVIDMVECPEDERAEEPWPLWFRKDYVDLLVPTVDDAYDFVQKVEEDVQDLYRMMKQYGKVVGRHCFIVGDPDDLPVEEQTDVNDCSVG